LTTALLTASARSAKLSGALRAWAGAGGSGDKAMPIARKAAAGRRKLRGKKDGVCKLTPIGVFLQIGSSSQTLTLNEK
jgi:hypothetical protein